MQKVRATHPFSLRVFYLNSHDWSTYVETKSFYRRDLIFWYESAVLMQECYDHQIPLQLRLQKLSRILENRERLLTVDKEILFLAASTRWLTRCKSHDFALLVHSEYCALNHRLTNGATSDSLKLLADISSREWINAA